MRRILRQWRQAAANRGSVWGWASALPILGRELRSAWRPGHPKASAPWLDTDRHCFDDEHGTETSGLIWGGELQSGMASDAWNTAYYGIAPSIFHRAMAQIITAIEGATFIDLGAGKGRALLLASQYAFARVVGVELVPQLHAIAGGNVAAWRQRHPGAAPIDVVLGDAAEYLFPAGPMVVYLYHPFCRPVLERVLRNLEDALASSPRKVWVLYINAELGDVLDRAPFLERIWAETLEMESADRLADRVGSSQEECVLYRTRAARPA